MPSREGQRVRKETREIIEELERFQTDCVWMQAGASNRTDSENETMLENLKKQDPRESMVKVMSLAYLEDSKRQVRAAVLKLRHWIQAVPWETCPFAELVTWWLMDMWQSNKKIKG